MSIRRVYLYIASLLGLVIIVIGAVQLVNLGLKTWIFTKADNEFYFASCYEPKPVPVREGEQSIQMSKEECEKQQAEQRTARKQGEAARSIAFILVGIPVYLYHWRKIKNDQEV